MLLFLGAVIQIPFTVPSFFFAKAVIPGHMEPIPLSCAVLSQGRASGGGCASVWSSSVTVSPGCPPFVDMWGRAAYCRPDVGTHLQLTWEDADNGAFCPRHASGWDSCVLSHGAWIISSAYLRGSWMDVDLTLQECMKFKYICVYIFFLFQADTQLRGVTERIGDSVKYYIAWKNTSSVESRSTTWPFSPLNWV